MAYAHDDANDDVYVNKMRSILDGYPKMGAPFEPTGIMGHVWLGTNRNAEDVKSLKRMRITHVLNCGGLGRTGNRAGRMYGPESGVEAYMELGADDADSPFNNITAYFGQAAAFMDRAASQRGRVLIHCNVGINCSAAICAMYLMVAQRMPLLEAIRYLKNHRRVVLTNHSFCRQLVEFARPRGLLDDRDGGMSLVTPRDYSTTLTYNKAFTHNRKHGYLVTY